jgi:predicted Zn-dependent peptidase
MLSKHFLAVFLVLALCIFPSSPVLASQYSPEGFYDPEYLVLENGLKVVLKQRDVTHSVAIRLAVDVGTSDFECGMQELPHFLEHLLFTGTSKHSEAELDALIDENGGSWNASTGDERTVYEIDMYSPKVFLALDVLHEIITDSQISNENVELSRYIIHRESGGKPSRLKQALYRRGIGQGAYVKALLSLFPDSNVVCPDLQTAERITRDDVVELYEKYYVPNNMVLVVVGEFAKGPLMEKIRRTFGQMAGKPLDKKEFTLKEPANAGPRAFSGTFSPILGSDATSGIITKTEGYESNDFYVLSVMETYLDTRLYEKIRIERGLSYAPQSQFWANRHFGMFYVGADVNIDDVKEVGNIMREELVSLREGSYDPADIDDSKRSILLFNAQGYESNSDIADYYAAWSHELERGGLINYEDGIEKVGPSDVQRVAARYFADEKMISLKSQPTLTYTQLYVIIGIAILLAVLLALRLVGKLRKSLGPG